MSKRSPLIRALACICCEIERQEQPMPTEEHHLNLGGHAGMKRLGDEFSIPACAWHHRGEAPFGVTASEATYLYGPSLARSSKRFRETYGMDADLLKITNEKLNG